MDDSDDSRMTSHGNMNVKLAEMMWSRKQREKGSQDLTTGPCDAREMMNLVV